MIALAARLTRMALGVAQCTMKQSCVAGQTCRFREFYMDSERCWPNLKAVEAVPAFGVPAPFTYEPEQRIVKNEGHLP